VLGITGELVMKTKLAWVKREDLTLKIAVQS